MVGQAGGRRFARLHRSPRIASTVQELSLFLVAQRGFILTTFSDGCLGSNNDEGRSEV